MRLESNSNGHAQRALFHPRAVPRRERRVLQTLRPRLHSQPPAVTRAIHAQASLHTADHVAVRVHHHCVAMKQNHMPRSGAALVGVAQHPRKCMLVEHQLGSSSSGCSDGSGVKSVLDCSDASPKDSAEVSGDDSGVMSSFGSIDAAIVDDGSVDGEATGVVAGVVVAAAVVAAVVVAGRVVAGRVVAGRVVAGGFVAGGVVSAGGDSCSVGIPIGLGLFRASQN
ncbi:hypothetical protein FGB62_20g26 [Gracilaria domingensis]|nr:hypothetical protein FGB62_20g26 [Gracilaria domingensis]